MSEYSIRKEEVHGALGSGYILKEYVIAPDGHEERYSAERSVRELNYLARKLTAAKALLRELLLGGEHDGPCDPPDAKGGCWQHLLAARQRELAACDFLDEREVQP